MLRKGIVTAGLCSILILFSGCRIALNGAAASPTPTIISLPSVTETLDPPTLPPTPTPLPPPSPTPPTPSLTPTSPLPTLAATVAIQPAPPEQSPVRLSPAETASTTLSLTGAWDFTFGVMSLTQQNTSVSGTYQWYGDAGSGRVQGIILTQLHQFQGLWLNEENPNSQGFLRWRLAPDYASFSGTFERGNTRGQWCGVRSGQPLPPGCGFSGVWSLRFGNPPGVTGQATLTQIGQTVQGTYVDTEGHTGEIDGLLTLQSITEAKLSGTWRDDRGQQNSFDWRLNLIAGQTFQGRRNPGNSEWCGWREGQSEPKPCGWEG